MRPILVRRVAAPVLALLLAVPAVAGGRGADAPEGAAGGALSATEERIAAAIAGREAAALALVAELVEVNSGTMNFPGVRRVGEMLGERFAELGFAVRWVEGEPFGRAGHLVAERGDGDGLPVLLVGHLDTVFEPDSPFQHFERLAERKARGPGIIDMKGGDVVMLEALRGLAAVGALDDLDVTVVLTGDEERSGRPLAAARAALLAAAEGRALALGFEDGDGDPRTAVVARRGSTSWRLEVHGTPAHSSLLFTPGVGAGAAYETARILEGFRRELASEPDLTFNPGLVLAGTDVDYDATASRGSAFGKSNVIAEHAVVTGDLRALTPEQLERVQATMRRVVADSLPGTSAEIEFSDGYPPMAASAENLELLAALDAASRDLGHGPVTAVDPRNAGAADVSFVAEIVGGVLDGLGLMGTGGHTVEETADLATFVSQTQRAAVLLYRLSRR